jgi:hypothetical protein
MTGLFLFGFLNVGKAQEKKYQVACVGFYNLENLFDTIDSPDTDDKEFLPSGPNQWNSQKYFTKLQHLAGVINQLGDELTKDGPVFVGISEVENRGVVEDLVKTAPLSDRNFSFVHYESPDRRGIDVALLYQPKFFKVLENKPLPLILVDKPDFRSRDVLLVHGLLYGESFYVMVTHWPSRSSGEKVTAPLRAAAADLCRKAADSLFKIDKEAKILIMGDLNDDPTDESLTKHLQAKGKPEKVTSTDLFNPMWQLFQKGIGSLAYRDAWNLFDQIVISGAFLDKSNPGFRFYKAQVFNRKFLIQKEGQYAGYPLRTFGGGVYQGGYSDHFPVYLFLIREKK